MVGERIKHYQNFGYWVVQTRADGCDWETVTESAGNRSYAVGYFYGMRQASVHPALRLVNAVGRVEEEEPSVE